MYICGLARTITDTDLYRMGEEFGQVQSVKVVRDSRRQPTGVAFIRLSTPGEARALIDHVHTLGLEAAFAKVRRLAEPRRCLT